ncbi:unnamed protein product [Clonostachys byssicola]|uniref:Uncharacterized protein n=1 Tax=Clonostachys byssicola TaxID=160290 RepID=A0A9N9Y5Y7_9HYPO|nr:unnamed protein product [Clonostachys byssicola]
MLCKTFTALSVLAAATAVAATETHDGIEYEIRWEPNGAAETAAIKTSYETAAAEEAYTRIQSAVNSEANTQGIGKTCLTSVESEAEPEKLYKLKECIIAEAGEDIFFDLLADDITKSDAFWAKVIAESTTDRTKWIPARQYAKAYFNGKLTATAFALFEASASADAGNLRANAEHYYKKSDIRPDLSQSSNIFEGWGGVLSSFGTMRTNFTVPDFQVPAFGTDEYPSIWAIDSAFPTALQRVGEKKLVTGEAAGQTFGVLHISVRDFTDDKGSGIEIYSAVWYPPWDKASEADKKEFAENYVRDEAHHMVVEVVNLTLEAAGLQ